MTDIQKYAVDITRDIVVAKLSNTEAKTNGGNSGKSIADMFEVIYSKVFEICSDESVK